MWIHGEKKIALTAFRNFRARSLQIQRIQKLKTDLLTIKITFVSIFYAARFRARNSLNIFAMNS